MDLAWQVRGPEAMQQTVTIAPQFTKQLPPRLRRHRHFSQINEALARWHEKVDPAIVRRFEQLERGVDRRPLAHLKVRRGLQAVRVHLDHKIVLHQGGRIHHHAVGRGRALEVRRGKHLQADLHLRQHRMRVQRLVNGMCLVMFQRDLHHRNRSEVVLVALAAVRFQVNDMAVAMPALAAPCEIGVHHQVVARHRRRWHGPKAGGGKEQSKERSKAHRWDRGTS
jgi:hypothetical protein